MVLKTYTIGFLHAPLVLLHLPFGIDFSLEKVLNDGAMWGVFSEYFSFLLFFRICVTAALVVILLWFTKKKVVAVLLTILISGALGNIIDSLIYGHVIDMLHFTFSGNSYGVFNLADTYIFIGCLGLILHSFITKEKKHDASTV